MAGTLPKIYSKEEILNHTSPVLSATCDEPIISTPWLVASSTLNMSIVLLVPENF